MSKMERYTVKYVAGERRGSMLIALSPTEPCSALIDAVKTRLPIRTTQHEHPDVKDLDATLHLEDPGGPMLYAGDPLSDVLPGAKETVVVVFQMSAREIILLTRTRALRALIAIALPKA
jgi:hypothetical protein